MIQSAIHKFFQSITGNRHTITVKHNAGFFSCCSVMMKHIIAHYNECRVFPKVNTRFLWDSYKDKKDKNIGNYLFIPYSRNSEKYSSSFSEDIFITHEKDEDQFSDYSKINYRGITEIVRRYFTLSDVAENTKKEMVAKAGIDYDNTLAVYYRGQDKVLETNVPSYEEIEAKVREVLNKRSFKNILVQSDENEFIEFMKNKFDIVTTLDPVFKPNKMTKLLPVQYLVPEGFKKQQAAIFLASIKIVSECNNIILNSGNVGMWICLLRGSTSGVHQYLNPKDLIYGEKRELHALRDTFWIE